MRPTSPNEGSKPEGRRSRRRLALVPLAVVTLLGGGYAVAAPTSTPAANSDSDRAAPAAPTGPASPSATGATPSATAPGAESGGAAGSAQEGAAEPTRGVTPGVDEPATTAAAPGAAAGRGAPPGGPGSLKPVPARAVPTLPAVALDRRASFGDGVHAAITRVDPIRVSAQGPGEISGEGLAVHVSLVNESTEPVPTDVLVTLNHGRDSEAVPSDEPPAQPLAGVLQPGQTASGVYAFVVPPRDRGSVLIRVSYAAGKPLAVFTSK
jgi:hypothetical protein